MESAISALVFEIERYAIEDGPGIRSVVFFKGCDLRCDWCQNPESQLRSPQIMYDRNRCVACGRCSVACPQGAIIELGPLGFVTDHEKCTGCGVCVDACFSNARKLVGRHMSIDEVMKTLRRDLPYYIESRGGVTLSGGEPLIQVEAVREIAMRCRNEGIHTAIETAGHVPWSNFERVLPYIDFFYYDLKHIDSVEHHARTGVGLHLILENLRRLSNLTANLVVRVPIVPGMNDSESVMEVLFAFIAQQTGARRVELLPFHRLGMAKYEGLGRPYALEGFGNMSQERCQELAEIGRSLGLAVKVGRENT